MLLARVAREEAVGPLDIAMHEPSPVGGVEAECDLTDQLRGPLGTQTALSPDDRAQVRPVDVAHDHVEHSAGLARLVDGPHVLVIDRRGQARLALEALSEAIVSRVLRRDHFQGDSAPKARLQPAIHDAHAAPPKLRLYVAARTASRSLARPRAHRLAQAISQPQARLNC